MLRRLLLTVLSCCLIDCLALAGEMSACHAAALSIRDSRGHTPSISVAAGVHPSANSWATVRITLPHLTVSKVIVSLQDRRGGLIVQRQLTSAPAAILMPLPYIVGVAGPGGSWPVRLKICHSAKTLVAMDLNLNLPLVQTATFRTIAVPRDVASRVNAVATAMGEKFAPMWISRRQLASTPALNFSSCRFLLLDDSAARLLSHHRVMTLLSLGVRFIGIGASPPEILPHQSWQNIGQGDVAKHIWVTPKFDGLVHGPPVVVPHLARMRISPLRAPVSWQITAWAMGPLTILMLGLLYVAVIPRRRFLLSMAIGVVLLSTVTVLWLTDTTGRAANIYTWRTFMSPGPLSLRNTLVLQRSLRAQVRVSGDSAAITLPLAWSLHSWLAFHGLLIVQRNTAFLKYPITRHATILTYTPEAVLGVNPPIFATLPAQFNSPNTRPSTRSSSRPSSWSGREVLLSGGQIFMPAHRHHGHDFDDWLTHRNPRVQATLRAWLLMQFNPNERYYLLPRSHPVGIIAIGPPTAHPAPPDVVAPHLPAHR